MIERLRQLSQFVRSRDLHLSVPVTRCYFARGLRELFDGTRDAGRRPSAQYHGDQHSSKARKKAVEPMCRRSST